MKHIEGFARNKHIKLVEEDISFAKDYYRVKQNYKGIKEKAHGLTIIPTVCMVDDNNNLKACVIGSYSYKNYINYLEEIL